MCIARYTLAVDRRFSRNNNNDGQNADFIPCVAFGKAGEHAEKYYRKGIKVAVSGRIQTGSYTNRDGVKVYTTEVIVEDQEFAESRNASQQGGGSSYSGGNSYGGGSSYGGGNNSYGGGQSGSAQSSGSIDGFMNIPDGIDEELPFT
jgi:single-strand DNA-binding protein